MSTSTTLPSAAQRAMRWLNASTIANGEQTSSSVKASKQRLERRHDRLHENRRRHERAQALDDLLEVVETPARPCFRRTRATWRTGRGPDTRASLTISAMSRPAARTGLDGSAASINARLNSPSRVSINSLWRRPEPAITGATRESVPSPNTPSFSGKSGDAAPPSENLFARRASLTS